MLAFEERVDVQAERDLDRLTRRARRGDDDHAAGWRVRSDERAVIGRERAVLDLSSHGLAGVQRRSRRWRENQLRRRRLQQSSALRVPANGIVRRGGRAIGLARDDLA